MTGPRPLSGALKGATAKNTTGSIWSDLGSAVSGLAAEAKAEQAKREELALAAALEASRNKRLDEQTAYTRNKDARDFELRSEDVKGDNERLRLTSQQVDLDRDEARRLRDENNRLMDEDRDRMAANLETFRTGMLGLRERSAAQADKRIDLNERRFAKDLKGFKIAYTKDGQPQYINNTTMVAEPVMETDDGYGGKIWLPRSVVEGKSGTPAYTPRHTGGHTVSSEPKPSTQGAGVDETGAPDRTVQPGAQTDPANAHAKVDVPPAQEFKPAQGTAAIPSNPERDAQATYDALKGQVGIYGSALKKVGFKSPNFMTYMGMEAARTPKNNIPGINLLAAGIRGAGNSYVGAMDPDYQLVQNGLDAVGAQFVKLMSGLASSDTEAQRLFNTVGMTAGDTEENVRQKLEQLDNIIVTAHVKAGRAAPKGKLADALGDSPVSSESRATGPRSYWDEQVAAGMSPEEATAATLKKYPNARMK